MFIVYFISSEKERGKAAALTKLLGAREPFLVDVRDDKAVRTFSNLVRNNLAPAVVFSSLGYKVAKSAELRPFTWLDASSGPGLEAYMREVQQAQYKVWR